MISTEKLEELNKLTCPVHNKTPHARIEDEDIKYEHCCEDFESTIKNFVRETVLNSLREISKDKFGI